jgi:DNA-binding NarL/FixJ family response regulator
MPIRLMVVDDSELILKSIRTFLESELSIQIVAEAGSYSEVALLADTLKPDVVLLDLHLPDDRIVSPADVKASLAGSRILAMSVWNDDATKALAAAWDAVMYIDKATLGTELIPAIKRFGLRQAALE